MRTLALLFAAATSALAANEPVELPPLPKDSLSSQLDPDVRTGLEAARRKYASPDETEREAAVALFAAVLHPLADDDLLKIADGDGFPLVRLRAAEALMARENKGSAMSAAKLAVCGVPPTVRGAAADMVRKSGNAEAIAFLTEVFRKGALRPEKGLGFDRSYNDLADLLYRTLGAAALGRIATPEAVKELCGGLREPEWELRAAAARALGDAGDRGTVPALARSVQDKDMDVAIESALALGRLGGAPAEAALETAAKDPRPLVAKMAARALRHAKERAAAPVPPPANPPAGGGGTEAQPPPTRALPPPAIDAPEGSTDLLFVIDATFSMAGEWPRVHCQVESDILRHPDDGDLRVGFVLFRDFDNQWLTRQHFMTWDLSKVISWWRGQAATGANAFMGSASDKALTVATMLNLRRDYRARVTVIGDAPPNDLSIARHRARLLHMFEGAIVDGVYIDRDTETRGFMTEIAEAGGGQARAFRSGAEPAPK